MTKKEMAAWYWAICVAAQVTKEWPSDGDEALECWEAFFLEWPRLLFVESGRPGGFPWNHETD